MRSIAIWSKESAAMIVPILALIHIVKYRVQIKDFLKRFSYLLIPISIYILTRAIALKQYFIHSTNTVFIENPLMFVPWHERFFTALEILIMYLGKLLVPIHLSADYSYDTIHLTFLPALAGGICGNDLGDCAVFRTPSVAGWLRLYFRFLVPVSNLSTGRYDHGGTFMYAPSIGFVLLLAWFFSALVKVKYLKTASIVLLVIASLLRWTCHCKK